MVDAVHERCFDFGVGTDRPASCTEAMPAARRAVCGRRGCRDYVAWKDVPMGQSPLSRLYSSVTEAIDHRFRWDHLPKLPAMLTLIGIRNRLRAENLYDSGRGVADRPPPGDGDGSRHLTARTLDGTYNDLDDPLMGSLGSRFGRNVPLDHAYPDPPEKLLTPNPRTVSLELLTRDEFKPARTLNLLAAAWIQFEVHDWFSHGKNEAADPWTIPLAFATALRSGEHGKLRVEASGLVPQDIESHVDLSGVAGNFWVGLAILHALFMFEHNAICDRLHEQHPELGDDDLYDRARLVNAALMAKIHTVDWTPAIIAHPTTVTALRANWWGILGEGFDKRFGRRTSNELIHGIPGSPKALYGVPYSLTEEFVAVYRMHPLIPDEFVFRSLHDDRVLDRRTLPEIGALHVRACFDRVSLADSLYSFGIANPGAITLHNYPRFLQRLERPDGELIDLAATDIVRTRERGVPRYNEFRRLLHLEPVKSFEELTDNPEWAAEIRRVYEGDIERVDLMVGLYAEPVPRGFGFSDTAFRIFILMASRRLEADRFFTDDYRPEVYTPAGIEWVETNDMRSVLLRHCPDLEPSLRGVANPFAPWRTVGS